MPFLNRRASNPCPAEVCGRTATIKLVRYYTTRPLNGGITFKCVFCDHSVSTLDLDPTQGNRRTQAAAAINQHAKQMHFAQLRIAAPMNPGSRGAF
jgi:hypothetical protein